MQLPDTPNFMSPSIVYTPSPYPRCHRFAIIAYYLGFTLLGTTWFQALLVVGLQILRHAYRTYNLAFSSKMRIALKMNTLSFEIIYKVILEYRTIGGCKGSVTKKNRRIIARIAFPRVPQSVSDNLRGGNLGLTTIY